jgi:hypothetical protein
MFSVTLRSDDAGMTPDVKWPVISSIQGMVVLLSVFWHGKRQEPVIASDLPRYIRV